MKPECEESLSNFAFNCNYLRPSTERPKIRAEFPDMKFGDVSKACGAAWKKLTDDEKAEFEHSE